MIQLDNIHPDRFYTDLVINGVLIQETVDGTEEFGTAHYFKDGKVYLASVYLENDEGCGINELEAEEIKDLLNALIQGEGFEGDADAFYSENDWAVAFK